jgi:uncharacterized protein (TIGR02001 family)
VDGNKNKMISLGEMAMTKNMHKAIMNKAIKITLLSSAAILGAFVAAPTASAQSSNPFSLSANAALVSDYRFRGLSLSNKDTAFQGGFDVSHKSGFYVGTWGSSIQNYNGAELELDIYGGYSTQVGSLTTDIGFYAYTYPGATANTDYYEVYGSVSGSVDTVSWSLGTNYAFNQDGTGDQDNVYVYLNTSAPIGDTPFSVAGNIAYEEGAFANNTHKWDWLLGLSYSFQQFSLSVNYIDTANYSGASGDAAVMAMLSASF